MIEFVNEVFKLGKQSKHLEGIAMPYSLLKEKLKQNLQCFDVTEITNFCENHIVPEMFSEHDGLLPENLKPPSENCVFFINGKRKIAFFLTNKISNIFQLNMLSEEKTHISFAHLGNVDFDQRCLNAENKHIKITPEDMISEVPREVFIATQKSICAIIAAITNNTIIDINSNISRQRRRQIKSKYKIKNSYWGKVTWDILNKKTVTSNNQDQKYFLPLHWRRGHWRRSKENDKKSVQRLYALNPQDRKLWWTWIEGYWAGHPAFGFKRSIYQPKVGEKKWLEQLK